MPTALAAEAVAVTATEEDLSAAQTRVPSLPFGLPFVHPPLSC